MAKVKFPVVMLVIVGMLATFLCGIFVGRSGLREVLYVELPETQPTAANQTAPEQTAQSTDNPEDTEPTAPETTGDTEEATLGVVNINIASVEELTMLPGIGEVLAQRIVDYRLENGPFQTPEELMNVSGIGEKKYEDVASYIIVR